MSLSTLLTRPMTRLGQCLLRRLREGTKPITDTPLVGALTDVTRSRGDLIIENALLRQQLLVLQRQGKRPKLHWRDRARTPGGRTGQPDVAHLLAQPRLDHLGL